MNYHLVTYKCIVLIYRDNHKCKDMEEAIQNLLRQKIHALVYCGIDMAYCLISLFGVNMPPQYSRGRNAKF